MEVDSGDCLSKQQNKCGKSKTEILEQFIDLSVSLIKPHSFTKLKKCQFYLILSKYEAARQTITDRYKQCRSRPSLTPKSLQGPR